MGLNKRHYLWLAVGLLVIFLWVNRGKFFLSPTSRPTAESLEFNLGSKGPATRPLVLSPDENINIQVFENANPAVVNISTTTLSVNFWLEVTPREGQGSGFIIDSHGYILTNNHVVAKAQKMIVTMANGAKVPATLVGRDPASDLAVIKIPSNYVDVVATLGDSDKISVGQKAIAIGNPFGLSHTLTTGIISALNRGIKTEDGNEIENLIQTDAAINPGNSGGPLLNSSGEVIGINAAIFSLSGGYQGIGFAIPINRATQVATDLITSGRVARPWLGITGISVTPSISEGLGLEAELGVLIMEVIPDGPADAAGLHGGDREVIVGGMRLRLGGDIVTALDGSPISDMKELVRQIERRQAGQSVTIGIVRKGRPIDVIVALTERP